MEGKGKGGRPTKYKPEYAKLARKLCAHPFGATDAQLAEFFEVSEDTINEWKKVQPEFSESLKEGKADADNQVEVSLFKRATGYSHPAVHISQYKGDPVEVEYTEHYPPDTTACIFWLKNRRKEKWRDKQEHEIGGKNGAPVRAVIKLTTK